MKLIKRILKYGMWTVLVGLLLMACCIQFVLEPVDPKYLNPEPGSWAHRDEVERSNRERAQRKRQDEARQRYKQRHEKRRQEKRSK